MFKKNILLGVLSLSLLTSNTIVPLSVVAAAAEIEPSRSLVTNSTSILEKINGKYSTKNAKQTAEGLYQLV